MKKPELQIDICCDEMKEAVQQTFIFIYRKSIVFDTGEGEYGSPEINYCPFCGKYIIFKEKL